MILIKNRYTQNHIYTAHERSIEKCKEENLLQAAYFIERELTFYKEVRLIELNIIKYIILIILLIQLFK